MERSFRSSRCPLRWRYIGSAKRARWKGAWKTVSYTHLDVYKRQVEEHSIQWIYLQTKKGGQRKNLAAGEAPAAAFALVDDEPIAAYAYCNLHGLWRKEI